MTTLEMAVNIDCPGCQSKVKRALQKLDGVDNIDIDMILQKVTVSGSAEPDMILTAVRKTGRNADLWLSPYEIPFPENDDDDNYFHGQFNYHQIDPSYYNLPSYNHQPASTEQYDHYYNHGDQEYDYDYENHYYDEYDRDNYRLQRRRPNSTISAMFSDENVNACSIM